MRLVPPWNENVTISSSLSLSPRQPCAPSLFFFLRPSSAPIHSPSRPCSLDTARYQAPPPLSIFCQRIPDFLIAINVRPIAAPFAALACSNVSAPRFSYLKFRSYPHALIPAQDFLDFSPLKSMLVCSRPFHHACSLPSLPPPYSTCYSFDLPFRRASLRICA